MSRPSLALLVLLFFAVAFIPACDSVNRQSGGYQPPEGTLQLLPAQGQPIRLSLLNFTSPRLSSDQRTAWMNWFGHELSNCSRWRGRISFVESEEIKEALKLRGAASELTPFDLPDIIQKLGIDFYVFIEDRAYLDGWKWNLLIYNGRSGAFVERVSLDYSDHHLQKMSDAVVNHIHRVCVDPGSEIDDNSIPDDVLLEKSVYRFHRITKACRAKKCIDSLNDFEWLKSMNPDMLRRIYKDRVYASSLRTQAQGIVAKARVRLLFSEPVEALNLLLPKIEIEKSRKAQVRLYVLAGKAAIMKGDAVAAEKYYNFLKKLDKSAETNYGLGWVALEKKNYKEAEKHFKKALRRDPGYLQAMEELIRVYQENRDLEGLWKAKRKLAKACADAGMRMRSNVVLMELLDNDFSMDVLRSIRLDILPPLDRKNLATMLSQKVIQPDEDTAEVFSYLVSVMLLDGKTDKAETLLQEGLDNSKVNYHLLQCAADFYLSHRTNSGKAKGFFNKIPKSRRDPVLFVRIAQANRDYEVALNVLKSTSWPTELKSAVATRQAELMELQGELKGALKLANKQLKKDPCNLELQKLAARLWAANKNEDKFEHHSLVSWQLGGKQQDWSKFETNLFKPDYNRLVMPHPLTTTSGGNKLRSVGKVVIVDGSPNKNLEWWQSYLSIVAPYVPRKKGRVFNEIRSALASRFSVLGNPEINIEFRKQLDPSSNVYKKKHTTKDMLELATATGVDSLFVIRVDEEADIASEEVLLKVALFFYDSNSNQQYRTDIVRTFDFFRIYRFNYALIVLMIIVLILLAVIYRRFSKYSLRFKTPLDHAKYLIEGNYYGKAASILKRHGYSEDHRTISGHLHAQQGDYIEALRSFTDAKDYENALVAFHKCADTEEANNLAGDVYYQTKKLDKAEYCYKKANNLQGLAKIYNIQGKVKAAARVLGQYYYEKGNTDEAVSYFHKIKDFNRSGIALFNSKRYEEALVEFRQAKNQNMIKKCLAELKWRERNGNIGK